MLITGVFHMTKKSIFLLVLSILSMSPLYSEQGKVTGDAVLEHQCNTINLSVNKYLENKKSRLNHTYQVPNYIMTPKEYYKNLVRLHIIDTAPSEEEQKKSPPPKPSEAKTIITCLQQLEERHHANQIEVKVLNLIRQKVRTLAKPKAQKFIKELQKLVNKTLDKSSKEEQKYYQALIELRVLNLVRKKEPNLKQSEAEVIIEHLRTKKIQKEVRELGETKSSIEAINGAIDFAMNIKWTKRVEKVIDLGYNSIIEMTHDVNEGVEYLANQLIKLKDLSKQLTF